MFNSFRQTMRRSLFTSVAHALLLAVAAVALLQPPTAAMAQAPARSLASLADSIAAAGDSARAFAMLDSAVRADRRDGAAWHQLGLLSWNMAKSKRSAGYINDQRAVRLLRGADTALRLATQLSPDSARYWLALSRFNLTSGVATMRFASGGQSKSALTAATKVGDTQLIAMAADEVGMSVWRRYEPTANRALVSDGQQKIQLSMFNNFSRDKARDFVNSFINKIQPPTGEGDYREAFEHFRTAVTSDPTSLRYSRHLYMAYGERKRWNELREVANARAREYPLDYQAQLARGLAAHRLGDEKTAQAAFDSAFTLMDDEERARMTRFTRIMRPKETKETKGTVGDTVSFNRLPPAQQRGLEQMYWYMNDPLTLTSENELRLEFLSRVTWADFRWTSEDMNLLGADTDRGDVFVRYGPPDLEMTVPGSTNVQANTDGGVTLVWAYNSGLVFFFDMPPGFGTARFAFQDRDNVDQIRSAMPVSWANVASTRIIDTIPVRVARFRARGDSSDAVIASRIPLDSLVRGLDLTSAPVDIDFRVFDQFVRVQGVESAQQSVRPDSSVRAAGRLWTRRLGPGINVVRVEALQADSKRAARAMVRINPDAVSGFGMSDILLGNKPEAKAGTATKRWTDVNVEPGVGVYATGASVGLVWEMYDLVAKDGSNKYRVGIMVERTDRSALGSFTARLVDGLGRSIGREQSSRDKLTIAFDRTSAASGTLVEFFSLNLADQSAGSYRLRVEVTDLANGKKVSRETAFVIR